MARVRFPRLALAVALATLLAPIVVGSVSAAPTRPTVSVTATVSGANVSVRIDVNRTPGQVAKCGYLLDLHVLRSCGTAQPVGTTASRYSVNLTDQKVGKHTFIVALALKDRGIGAGSAKFTIVPAPPAPKVFALAFTNLDGQPGYNPALDVLISKLVDADGSGAISAGDVVLTDRYPKTFALDSFAEFTVKSHVVTGIYQLDAQRIIVTIEGSFSPAPPFGPASFAFVAAGPDGVEGWEEKDYFGGYEYRITYLDDSRSFDPPNVNFWCSTIRVDPLSPSRPADTINIGQECNDGDDDPHVDVILTP